MFDRREFVVDSGTAASLAIERIVPALIGAALFSAAAFWLLATDHSGPGRFIAISTLVFFGGLGLLTLLVIALRPILKHALTITVDSQGISWTSGYQGLAWSGLGPRRVTVPWSNVESLNVTDSGTLPLLRSAEAVSASLREIPGNSLFPQLPKLRFVGVTVRDIDAVASGLPRVQGAATKLSYAKLGVLIAGPVVGSSAEEFLETLQAYRTAATR